jgi:2-methylisocitrate lyase-like PEP mutase family enzyme
MVLEHIAEIVGATDLPVNADFQSGYAKDADGVAESVRLCVGTGVSGLSIEDSTGEGDRPLFEVAEAVDRISAARAAIDASGQDVMLVGRAECFLVGRPDLSETIERLQAYAEAGADVLYAPGLKTREEIAAVVSGVSPKPVNVLVHRNIGLSVSDFAGLGVRRVSVGSALSRAAWSGFMRASGEIAEKGSFEAFEGLTSFAELEELFAG